MGVQVQVEQWWSPKVSTNHKNQEKLQGANPKAGATTLEKSLADPAHEFGTLQVDL